MKLCLDVGNSQIFGGVFDNEKLLLTFRHDTKQGNTSDQFGIFLKSVLRENNIDSQLITAIAICSVVPGIDYSLRAACIKYLGIEPFMLQVGVKTGLKIKYRNPLELGADRMANAIAAVNLFPQKNIIAIDFGTATTFCAISAQKEYLGGVIMPGMRLSMTALQANTAKLSTVEIIRAPTALGRTTAESIQSGLYFSQLGAMQIITQKIKQQTFNNEPVIIIGTGGFAHLFTQEACFDAHLPDLVLHGLRLVLQLNVKG